MKKQIITAALLSALVLAGCGESGSAMYKESPAAAYGDAGFVTNAGYAKAESKDYYEDYDDEYAEEGGSTQYEEAAAKTGRKLIRNVSLDVETKNYDELTANVVSEVKALGGYVENSNSWNGSAYSYSGSRTRNTSMTLRIPADRLDEFLSHMADMSNITRRSENVTDVTLTYVDLESHKEALKAEEQRLIEMMEKAETIEDLITIEGRLSDIRYQVESMESQLRSYDNQVDYATLQLSITEVEELTPVEDRNAFEKMGEGFISSLKGVGNGIVNFFVWLISNLPYLVVWGGIFFGIFLVIRGIFRKITGKGKGKSRKQRKLEAAAQAAAPAAEETKPEDK
ncbi:MAG: DUF4349 domain-containing protein [Lachnospiraceae bacterium]|nr:DUF4349 domain-containing protein [Lachnospiraceae bacterium]